MQDAAHWVSGILTACKALDYHTLLSSDHPEGIWSLRTSRGGFPPVKGGKTAAPCAGGGRTVKKLIVSCPGCSAKYDVGKFEPGTKFKCKSCEKTLIVPQGAGEGPAEAAPAKPVSKSGTARHKPGAKPSRGRRDDYDDEMEEERPLPRTNKGPNWPLLGGIGAAVLIMIIIGVVMASNASKKAAEEAAAKKALKKGDIDDKIPDPPAEEKKEENKDTKAEKKPKKEKDTGEFIKETYAEDDKRTQDEKVDNRTKVDRLMLRKKIFDVDSSVKSDAEGLLSKFKENFQDPPVADECLEKFQALGKKAFPAALNFITNMNHKNEEDAKAASQLFETIARMAAEFWKYENEYTYGMFEDGEEKWKAITEMKELWIKHQKD